MNESEWESTPFPRFTDQQEAEIVRHSPIVEVAQALGIATTDQGDGTHRGACPWCRSPAFYINLSSQGFVCHSCAEQGRDVIVLTCKMRELWRPDALQWLAQRAGLTLREQRITDVSLAQVRMAVPLLSVVQESRRQVRAIEGGDHLTRCPLCDSFRCAIVSARNMFFCEACQEGGDAIRWLELVDRMSFEGAVEHLARQYGVTLIYEDAE
jgi:DNA primase